jgi:AraC-like DNA-binding protein
MGNAEAPQVRAGEPLRRYNVLSTRDPDELRERLAPLYAVSRLNVPPRRARFTAVLNHHQLESVALSYARYGAPVQITMSNMDFYTQGFGVRGYGEARSDGHLFKIYRGHGGTAGPGATAMLDYRAGLEHVFLKIPPNALNRKLSALLGNPVGRPLRLDGEYDSKVYPTQYRLLRFVMSELDRSEDGLPTPLLAEFEQSLIVGYLYSNLSNYSHLLSTKQSRVAPWQVERAMAYIEANWDKPISIEDLASASESSARSLFATFRNRRGCTPMAFVTHVRLLRARDILSQATLSTSVASVARQCGFQGSSHFARRYFSQFGELPSDTLRRARGLLPPKGLTRNF